MRAALSVNTVARLERDSAKCAALVHLAAGDVPAARTLVVKFLNWRDAGKYVEAFLAGIGVAVGVHAGDLAVVDAFFDSELLKRAVDNREAELCGFLLPGFSEILRARGMSDELTDALVACVANSIVDPYLSVQACVARYAPLETLDDVELQVARYLAESVTAIGPVHAAYVRAIVARRRGALARAKRFAVDAARGYEHFGWRLRQAQALEMAADYAAAETLFERCGATADARRAAAGVRRKNRRASFGARLTPREQEVARMIARGRSDRDVAHVLQISVRTVHHHVEAILSKLGVANRERIASALQNGATDRRLPR
jgi:DNA-binding CsgD family transcriptional regulator